MTLKDFRKKYNLKAKQICEACDICPQRLYVLEQGGCHRAMVKYAPIIEGLVENCKDKIYIPPKEDTTIYIKRVDKIPFTAEEIKLVEEKPFMLPFRTRKKIFDGHLFSKKVHDDIIKALKGESDRYKGSAMTYARGG